MQIRELVAAGSVLTVSESDDLALANQMMLWAGVKHLPVVRDGVVVGVLSANDLLEATSQQSRDASRRPVGSAMSHPAEVISPEADTADAAERMVAHGVGCLPVVSEGALLGIVTRTDLLAREAMGGLDAAPTGDAGVRSAMRAHPATVEEDDDLVEAALRMRREGIKYLPVVDGAGRVVGMLSDQDVRAATGRAWLDGQQASSVLIGSMKVAHAMSAPATTVPDTASLALAARYFMDHRVGALPVVDVDDHLVGIVSYLDMLAAAYKPMGWAPAP